MIPGFRIKPSTYVGLAVHHERLTLIQLKQVRKQIRIDVFAKTKLPIGSIQDGKIKHPDALGQAIKTMVETHRIKQSDAALALPASQVINKRIRVAAFLNDQERAAEISSNLSVYLPGIDERLHFDFVPLEKQKEEVELQLIAARAAQVETYIQLAKAAGLTINLVDVDVYALLRGIRWMSLTAFEEITLLLDMDMTTAQLILLNQGSVVSIYPIMIDTDEVLVQQIKRGLHIFSLNHPAISLKKMLLTGCLPHPDKLKILLEHTLSIRIEKWETLNHVTVHSQLDAVELKSSVSEWLVAFGLAWRGLMHGGN